MKTIRLSILTLLVTTGLARAATYHVSPAGQDTNSGAAGAPFLTIQKAATVMTSGDVCLIASGTYRETVTPASDGVTFQAAAGAVVTLSGYEAVTNWTLQSNSIYAATLSWDLGDENQLLYNGQMMNLARWPNKSNFNPFDLEAYKSTSGTTNSVSHAGIPNWNWGGGGVIWYLGKSRWTSWRRPLTGGAAGVVSFANLPASWDYAGSHSPANGGEFFLQNIYQALDSAGEWFTDRAARIIYFWPPGGGSPAAGTALVRRRTEVLNLSGRARVTVDGLMLEGGRVNLNSAAGCVIRNCRILYGNHTIAATSSYAPGTASIVMNTSSRTNFILRNDIQWGAGNGLILKGTDNVVDNNRLANFNYLGSYACPLELNNDNQVSRNEIFNGGRDLIRGGAYGSDVGYNDLHHSNLINDDCGPIYTCCNTDYGFTRFHHNWIHDCQSRDNNFASYKAAGIYLDNGSRQIIVDHNVCWNLEWSCIQFNWAVSDLWFYNNTLWNNAGPESQSIGFWQNGYTITNILLYNTLANEGSFSATSQSNTCLLALGANPFENFAARDFTPKAGTCPVDAGRLIPGVTDGFAGLAPDTGAYERGVVPWVAGPDWKTNGGFPPATRLRLALVSPAALQLTGEGLSPLAGYLVEQSPDLVQWSELGHFTAPVTGAYQTTNLLNASRAMFYRLTRLYAPHVHPGSGLMTFAEFGASAHNAQVPPGAVLTNGLPAGITATVGGTSGGFGVSTNIPSPGSLAKPTFFVWGDSTGSSLLFSPSVSVPSLWTSSPSWALANGQQKITGKLNGNVVWVFTNSTPATAYFEVTNGVSLVINELLIQPKWIGVDNITVAVP